MKKNFVYLSIIAIISLISCTKESRTSDVAENVVQVTFSVNLKDNISTRSISDGKSADRLVYAVFDENGKRISTIPAVDKTTAFPATETISLAKGQTYKIAFWAQNSNCNAYSVDTDNMVVSVDYTDGDSNTGIGDFNNNENRDAFFKTVEVTLMGNTSINVEMKRPFAQINVGAYQDDWNTAVASGIEIEKSAVIIENAATSIDLLTGAVGAETTDVKVSYSSADIPAEELKIDLNKDGDFDDANEKYVWLSMSYILVADHDNTADEYGLFGSDKATLQSLKYSFIPFEGNDIVFDEGLTNVPVQRNWRTNIIGSILTGDVHFNISIDPGYEDDYNI